MDQEKMSQKLLSSQSFDEDAARLGKALVNQFYILLKTARLHDSSNVAWDQPMENFMKTVQELSQLKQDLSLRLVGDNLFLGDFKLKMDIDGFTSFSSVIDEMKKREVGNILFGRSTNSQEIRRFVYLFVALDTTVESPHRVLLMQMKAAGVLGIELEELEELKEDFEKVLEDTKELAKNTYFKTITAVNEVMENVKLGQAVSVKKAKRVVQSMVDLLLQEESTLLGLTTLRCHDEYTHNHSVNVCILALSLGQRLGFSKGKLSELGMAALFHDIGKADIPLEILNKPTDFTEEEWRVMRKHPIVGVKMLIRLKGLNELTIRMLTGAFEHHLNYDKSGYPRLATPWYLTLVGRVISISDCYDALTSSRVYNRVPYPPDKALKFMLTKSGRAFDPILLKIFVNAIGIYPIGTLVLLDSGELAVVMQTNPNLDKGDHPKIKLITDTAGNELDGDLIDLTKTDSTGRFLKSITKTVDPTKYRIDVSRYFL
jgi:HD-GYP domain-containing protein (c-di-GMP phosphodiesterase class II)